MFLLSISSLSSVLKCRFSLDFCFCFEQAALLQIVRLQIETQIDLFFITVGLDFLLCSRFSVVFLISICFCHDLLCSRSPNIPDFLLLCSDVLFSAMVIHICNNNASVQKHQVVVHNPFSSPSPSSPPSSYPPPTMCDYSITTT
ncbi:hypothetical protein L6452_13474 [Arctium lappa]|uniref:Uncharacterized protein n=1 Tax=Arctium lappa TaxID=4217 RepID=A0ACB9CIE0_ARCLA|nr:hypothetical protein L6452_13474 [Arctium lappa]